MAAVSIIFGQKYCDTRFSPYLPALLRLQTNLISKVVSYLSIQICGLKESFHTFFMCDCDTEREYDAYCGFIIATSIIFLEVVVLVPNLSRTQSTFKGRRAGSRKAHLVVQPITDCSLSCERN